MERKFDQEQINEMFSSPDFMKMWKKCHTPLKREDRKVGRNEICPYCDSGKKFKNCDCYEKYGNPTEY